MALHNRRSFGMVCGKYEDFRDRAATSKWITLDNGDLDFAQYEQHTQVFGVKCAFGLAERNRGLCAPRLCNVRMFFTWRHFDNRQWNNRRHASRPRLLIRQQNSAVKLS
jgi:hypothetical protein